MAEATQPQQHDEKHQMLQEQQQQQEQIVQGQAEKEAYLAALQDLIEEREIEKMKLKKLMRLSKDQEVVANCARTGVAGAAVIATGLFFTPFAPPLMATLITVGACGVATSTSDTFVNWMVRKQIDELLEQDLEMCEIVQAARCRYFGLPPPRPLRSGNEETKGKKKKKKGGHRPHHHHHYVPVEGEFEVPSSQDQDLQAPKRSREEILREQEEILKIWWLYPPQRPGSKGSDTSSIKTAVARTVAVQGVSKTAGRSAGLMTNAATYVADCAKAWKHDNRNKLHAKLLREYIAESISYLRREQMAVTNNTTQ